jgi:hypothetical protein
MANVDVHAWRMDVDPRAAVVTPAIMVMFDDGSIRVVHTFGDARAVVADLIANPLGIGGLREYEPQCGRDDAKKYLAHCNSSPGTSRQQLHRRRFGSAKGWFCWLKYRSQWEERRRGGRVELGYGSGIDWLFWHHGGGPSRPYAAVEQFSDLPVHG